jgi:hypothetical protein
MRRLQCAARYKPPVASPRTIGNDVIARLLREEFTLFRVTGAGTRGTPTNDRRDNVLHTPKRAHALNYGGTTD